LVTLEDSEVEMRLNPRLPSSVVVFLVAFTPEFRLALTDATGSYLYMGDRSMSLVK